MSGPEPHARATPPRAGFRLLRYFVVASLVLFTIVAIALYVLQYSEIRFFERVQREQSAFMSGAQAELARQHGDFALKNLVILHEAAHVNLTHVLANTLWERDFAPFVARAEKLPVDRCRSLAAAQPAEARTCFTELGRTIMDFPGFAALNAKVHATMNDSTVFKIKVYDLRGITVYSSELEQIGEDKADNLGWKTAVAGQPASELTHRDRFSTFEGVVENRDLIQSYIPVVSKGGGKVTGVFEIYSDVTPLLQQINAATSKIRDTTAANEAEIARVANQNQNAVAAASDRLLAIIGALLALLYIALLLIVRNGQRIIDAYVVALEQAARREELWHREKMAALATMAANVSHEVGNPLAVISGMAQNLARQATIGSEPAQSGGAGAENPVGAAAKTILEQTSRISRMMRQITEFARARREAPELVDVNQVVKAMCEFLAFDARFRGIRFDVHAAEQLPACTVVPDHLNEALMAVLQKCAEASARQPASPGVVTVHTEAREQHVAIRLGCASGPDSTAFSPRGAAPDTLLESAQRRVAAMGGELTTTASGIEIVLPLRAATGSRNAVT